MREGGTWRNEFELGKSRAMGGKLHLKECFEAVLEVGVHAALYHPADPSIDQRANPSRKTIQGAKGGHFVALFNEFFQGRIDHIRRVVHGAHSTQECAEDDPTCLFAIGEDLVVLAHHLVMPIQRPLMVVSRNHLCGQVERLTNMVYQWSRNVTQRWKIAQTWKELDPEHEVQLVLCGSSHRAHKTTFFFCWGVGFD